MSTVSIEYQGLAVEGTVDYSPEEGPSYACGGVPALWDAEVLSVEVDDESEFAQYDISLADARVEWEDEIIEALCEAY